MRKSGLCRKRAWGLITVVCLAVWLVSCEAMPRNQSSAPPRSEASSQMATQTSVSSSNAPSSSAETASSTPIWGETKRRTEPLTKAEATADMDQLIGYIEDVHPVYEDPDSAACQKTDAAKADFQKSVRAVGKTISMDDFGALCREYLASIPDLHTDIFGDELFNDVWQDQRRLSTEWRWDNGRLYLLDQNGKQSDRLVTGIGGVSVSKITETIGRMYDAENDVGTAWNNAYYSRFAAILARCGVKTDGPVTLTVTGDGGTEKVQSAFESIPSRVQSGEPDAGYYQKGDCFYLDLNQFAESDTVDQAARALNKAVDGGTKKVIWDLRGNPGGNSEVGTYIFRMMRMVPPRGSMHSRASQIAPYIDQTNDLHAVPNPNIKLVVLIDEMSCSSSTATAWKVQDGKLGILMGRTPIQAPDSYGNNTFKKELKYSSFIVEIATASYTRADQKANLKEVVPDIAVPFGEDELQAAFDYLK